MLKQITVSCWIHAWLLILRLILMPLIVLIYYVHHICDIIMYIIKMQFSFLNTSILTLWINNSLIYIQVFNLMKNTNVFSLRCNIMSVSIIIRMNDFGILIVFYIDFIYLWYMIITISYFILIIILNLQIQKSDNVIFSVFQTSQLFEKMS